MHADSRGDLTICLTMGLRPALLGRTLASLKDFHGTRIVAINDFGDSESNQVLLGHFPEAIIVPTTKKLGHHAAIDAVYRTVQTPYILHLEDDWVFSRTDFIESAVNLLESLPRANQVCLRDVADIHGFGECILNSATPIGHGALHLCKAHSQWFGHTFNPHVILRQRWLELGGYTRFAKERHISRYLRNRGEFTAYFVDGACRHVGGNDSVATPPAGRWGKLWRRLYG